jgi:lysophospholipase L1-like esterase
MRYALVGDSQGQGLFGPLSAQLQAAGHVVTLSRAVAGRDPGGWARDTSLPAQLAGAQPDVVIYLVAGNNGDLNASSYAQKVAALVSMARGAGARTVYWLSPATATEAATSARHEATANMEASIVPAQGATWLDMRPFTRSGHRDGVHFTSSAYAAWAASLAPYVQPSAIPGLSSLRGAVTTAATTAWWLVAGGLVLAAVVLLRPGSSEE